LIDEDAFRVGDALFTGERGETGFASHRKSQFSKGFDTGISISTR
jgi:hypothetical protein